MCLGKGRHISNHVLGFVYASSLSKAGIEEREEEEQEGRGRERERGKESLNQLAVYYACFVLPLTARKMVTRTSSPVLPSRPPSPASRRRVSTPTTHSQLSSDPTAPSSIPFTMTTTVAVCRRLPPPLNLLLHQPPHSSPLDLGKIVLLATPPLVQL